MPRQSAGLLVFRQNDGEVEVFLVHPGGPLWARRDDGAWSIPKGEVEEGEGLVSAAVREFNEETGMAIDLDSPADGLALGPVRQPGGKLVYAWAVRADLDAAAIKSNMFSMEWPPNSGRRDEYPEVDRAGWFTLDEAAAKILRGQRGLLEQLATRLTAP